MLTPIKADRRGLRQDRRRLRGTNRGEGSVYALVVVHSLTGTTKALAGRLGDAFGAPVVEIVEDRPRPRAARGLGLAVCTVEALIGRRAPVRPLAADPEAFETVAIGGPVWAGRPSSPLNGALARYAPALRGRRVGVFCTSQGPDPGVFFARAEASLGRRAEARLHLRARTADTAEGRAAIADFVRTLAAVPAEPGPNA